MLSLPGKKKQRRQPEREKREEQGLLESVPGVRDLFLPDAVVEERHHLVLGPEHLVRTYALDVYPHEVGMGWLDGLFSLGDVDLSVHVAPVENHEAIRQLAKIEAAAEAQYSLDYRAGRRLALPELEMTVRDIAELRRRIQGRADRLCYVRVFITVHARSEEELSKKDRLLKSIMAVVPAKLSSLSLRQLDALKTALPLGNVEIRDYRRAVGAGGTAAMFPVNSPGFSHPSGMFLGFAFLPPDRLGGPVFYDAFAGPPRLNNPHLVCFGASGSGKSVTLKLVVLRDAVRGVRTVVLDPEREYLSLARETGAAYVRVAPGHEAGLNPLDVEPEEDEGGSRVNLAAKVTEVRQLVGTIYQEQSGRSLDPRQRGVLEDAVREEYASRGISFDPASLYEPGGKIGEGRYAVGPVKKEMPTLSSLAERLEKRLEGRDLALVLKPYLSGGSLGMFDCQTTVNLSDAPVVVFDLFDISEKFSKLYSMLVVLSWVGQKFVQRMRGARKRVVVDEAWMFAQYPDTANFLQDLARRGRKHQTSLVVASQWIEEFLNREEGRAVIANSDTQVLLRQNPALVEEVVRALHLPGNAASYLRGFAPGQCLFGVGGMVTSVQVAYFDFEAGMVETARTAGPAP